MQCDMCGRESSLLRAKIEGTILNVCDTCSKHGKVLARVRPPIKVRKNSFKAKVKEEKKEIIETLVIDYNKRIRNKRESLGLKQKELARKLTEKESIIQKIESGGFRLPLAMARKFESILNIKLIEEIELPTENITQKSSNSAGFTIGDIIKIKKR